MKSIGNTLIFNFEFAEIKQEKNCRVFLFEKYNLYVVVLKMSEKYNIYQKSCNRYQIKYSVTYKWYCEFL